VFEIFALLDGAMDHIAESKTSATLTGEERDTLLKDIVDLYGLDTLVDEQQQPAPVSCQLCGGSRNVTIAHVIPRRLFNASGVATACVLEGIDLPTDPRNCLLLCRPCHDLWDHNHIAIVPKRENGDMQLVVRDISDVSNVGAQRSARGVAGRVLTFGSAARPYKRLLICRYAAVHKKHHTSSSRQLTCENLRDVTERLSDGIKGSTLDMYLGYRTDTDCPPKPGKRRRSSEVGFSARAQLVVLPADYAVGVTGKQRSDKKGRQQAQQYSHKPY